MAGVKVTPIDVDAADDGRALVYDHGLSRFVLGAALGGGAQVSTVVGTAQEIDVDSADPDNPVVSLADEVKDSLALADTALQTADLAAVAFSGDVSDLNDDVGLATDSELAAAIAALASVYQPLDSDLTAIAALSTTPFGRGLLALADAAALRSAASVYSTSQVDSAIGALSSVYQPIDSDLTALAALSTTSFGRGLLELANAAAGRTALGLSIGSDVQAYSAILSAYAGGDTPSAFTLGIVDSTDAAAWRAAIGAGTSNFDGAYGSLSGTPTIPTLDYGTYTPTGTIGVNITTLTPQQCQYLRVGDVVTVSGQVDATVTSNGSTNFRITLPIASDIGNSYNVGGAGAQNAGNMPWAIRGDITNNAAQFSTFTPGGGNHNIHFSFTYRII